MSNQFDQLYASSQGADEEFLYSVHTYDMRIRLRIAEIGGNMLLRDAIEREQVLIFNWLFDTAAHQGSLPPHFHSELVAVLTGRSIEAADKAMRTHIRYGLEHVLDVLRPSHTEKGWRVHNESGVRDVVAGKS